ncbi:hypothetical protein [Streptomyces sp. NPDC089919]|uniref:hypothetical protein n=1 Tax=Streptomyces sp. NPDC089919 TaxID=3155188 RepID=UPI00343C0A25
MRLRRLTPALAALALALALPGSAHAATGTFTAHFFAGGDDQTAELTDPADDTCHDLADDSGASGAISSAENATDATATLYDNDGCTGTTTVLAPGANAGDTGFRSVKFTTATT